MAAKKDNYSEVLKLSKASTVLGSISALLEWDQETHMPKAGIELRSWQLEMMASLVHKNKTSPAFKKALSKLIHLETGAIQDDSLLPHQIAAAREWRRDYLKAAKLPPTFVKNFAKTTSAAIHAWSVAKRHNSFAEFAPHLEKIVSLCRKKADILGYEHHPYDALLDLHEPEMTSEYLTPLFGKLKLSLTQLLKNIQAKPEIPHDFLTQTYPFSKQMHFGHILMEGLGFHAESSRLDISSHPFCSGLYPKDIRMTTRVIPTLPMSNIFSIIHEGGHGIYEQQLPLEHFGSPLCEAISYGIHESQSRFWETLLGKSYPFWQYFFPMMQKEFPEQLGSTFLDDFYKAINIVKPTLIRVESDEVTYCLHVILRYELEKALIEGSLKVKDLPRAWNEKMREYLGISPTNDGEGCLQDIHWSMGGFGYFPTYALGNLYAAQFFTAFESAHSGWKDKVAKGDFAFIRQWLHEQLHRYGRQYTPQEIVKKITGKPLDEQAYVSYLEQKFRKIYHIT